MDIHIALFNYVYYMFYLYSKVAICTVKIPIELTRRGEEK